MSNTTLSKGRDASIVEVLDKEMIADQDRSHLMSKFAGFMQEAQRLASDASSIVVTDISDTAGMQEAREKRLALKKIRIDAENSRKELKENSLRIGRAIDGVANIVKAIIVPVEEHLEKQEKFRELYEAEQKERIHAERVSMLQPYVEDVTIYNIHALSDDAFGRLVENAKKAREEEEAAKKKEEEERLARIEEDKKEQERIRLENEKLRKEKEEREKEDRKEAERQEAERKAHEEAIRKEREAREKLEREAREKEEREEAARKEAEEKERQAKIAPEKDKLFAFAERIRSLESPEGLSMAGLKIVKEAEEKLLAVSQEIKEGIKSL